MRCMTSLKMVFALELCCPISLEDKDPNNVFMS